MGAKVIRPGLSTHCRSADGGHAAARADEQQEHPEVVLVDPREDAEAGRVEGPLSSRGGPRRSQKLSPPLRRKGAATLLFLARPPGDAWVIDHEFVFVESDLGGEAPGAEADQPVA